MKWVDFTAVLVVAAGIAVALWWAGGRGRLSSPLPELQDWLASEPHVRATPWPEGAPKGKGAPWLMVEDRSSGRSAVWRQDFLHGRHITFQPCGVGVPLAPGLLEPQCLHASGVAGLPAVQGLAARIAEPSEAETERLRDFYASAGAAPGAPSYALHWAPEGRLVVLRVPAAD